VILSFFCACARPVADSPPVDELADQKQVARSFLESLLKDDYKAAAKDFDATMAEALPADKLEAAWKGVLRKTGTYQKQVGIRGERDGQYDFVFIGIQFEKSRMDLKVAIDSARRITGFSLLPSFKPPAYAVMSSFGETEVIVGEGEWQLPGTLSLPKRDARRFPAVVLVHGSGPHDRDESTGANKPFCDLAWGLASQGIAVLRYEKRTKAHGAKMAAKNRTLTLQEETVDDALAAVALVRKHKAVDPERVFVLGHSFGAFAGPRIVEQDKAIAGLILLAGNTRPLEDLILDQMSYLYSLDKSSPNTHDGDLDNLKKEVERIKKLREAPAPGDSELYLGLPACYWLGLRHYDPAATAARLKQPMLILQGERDYQVTMDDFRGWGKALAVRKNVELKSYPGLNHLFMEGVGKSTPAEYEKPGHVSPDVVNDVVKWVHGLK
jgi:alpha-beta hydrolase superfamily lysophospholipase